MTEMLIGVYESLGLVLVYVLIAIAFERSWAVKLLCSLRLQRGVWTQDQDGDVMAHFLRRNVLGQKWCHCYGPAGTAILLDDGTVMQPNCIKRWGHLHGKEAVR